MFVSTHQWHGLNHAETNNHSHACKRTRLLKRLFLIALAVFWLIAKPFPVAAETADNTAKLQDISLKYAKEGTVVNADAKKWTRIEFSGNYIDPVVVMTDPVADKDFIIGVRNVDALGFEISLKDCAPGNIPITKDVAYEVVEKDGLPISEAENNMIHQQFSWGACVTANVPF